MTEPYSVDKHNCVAYRGQIIGQYECGSDAKQAAIELNTAYAAGRRDALAEFEQRHNKRDEL